MQRLGKGEIERATIGEVDGFSKRRFARVGVRDMTRVEGIKSDEKEPSSCRVAVRVMNFCVLVGRNVHV